MTHAEFVEWQVVDQIEPFGDRRADIHTAMLMTLLAQIHRGKRGKKRKLEDFMPDWWRDRPRQTLRQRLRQADSEARRQRDRPAGTMRRRREA